MSDHIEYLYFCVLYLKLATVFHNYVVLTPIRWHALYTMDNVEYS